MTKHRDTMSEICTCCNPAIGLLAQHFVSRRHFLMLSTGTFAATVGLSERLSQATEAPSTPSPLISQNDTIADAVYIGDIVTVNDAQPTAEAVAIQAGEILAVGSRDQVMELQGEATQIIDLDGKTLVPGFIDGHGHLFQQGLAVTVANLLPPPDGDVNNIPKLQQTMRQWSETNPELIASLGWIVGNGYDDSQLQEQRHPLREELDAISTDRPVLLMHQSGHLAAANSKALELLGFTAATENPPGGLIRRQEGTNEPNGVLEENAAWAAFTKLGAPTPEQALDFVERGALTYASFGFTTAQEGRATRGVVEGLKFAAEQGRVPIDVAVYVDYLSSPDAHTWNWSKDEYTHHLRLAGAKLNFDGSPQGKTAWLTEPYYIPPEGQPTDYKGYPSLTDEQAIERVSAAYANNFQVQTHCNGDAAADQYIMAVRKATETHGAGKGRTVMIHAQTVREDQLDAMQELGILPAFFPSHTFYWGDFHRDSVLGPERAARISPTRSALNRGMTFTSHNDAPVVLPNAMRLMWSAVNRRTRTDQVLGEDQRVTPLEGLKSITLWAAYQHFEEDTKGSIEPGKLADFAILSANPLTVDPMTIRDIEVLETIKTGVTVYTKQI